MVIFRIQESSNTIMLEVYTQADWKRMTVGMYILE